MYRLHQAQTTPTEIREAAMLAQIHYEARQPRRWILTEEEAWDLGIRVLREDTP